MGKVCISAQCMRETLEVNSYLLCLAYLPLTCPLPSHPGVGQLQTRGIINIRLTSHLRRHACRQTIDTYTHFFLLTVFETWHISLHYTFREQPASSRPMTHHAPYFMFHITYHSFRLFHLGSQPVKSHEAKHIKFGSSALQHRVIHSPSCHFRLL